MPGKMLITLFSGVVLICSIVLFSPAAERSAPPPPAESEKAGPRAVPAREADNPRPATNPTTRPSRHRGRRGRRLTSGEEDEALEFLKANRPEHYQRLLDLKEQDERRYRSALRRMHRFVKRWRQMPPGIREATERERDLQIRIMEAVRKIRHAQNAGEKTSLKKQLEEAVSDHFRAEQTLRAHRLAYLADQIKELRRELAEQSEQREEIIAERVARWMKATKPVKPTTRPAED